MAGVTQLLFGIRGKRWDNDKLYHTFFNKNWCYPSVEEAYLERKKEYGLDLGKPSVIRAHQWRISDKIREEYVSLIKYICKIEKENLEERRFVLDDLDKYKEEWEKLYVYLVLKVLDVLKGEMWITLIQGKMKDACDNLILAWKYMLNREYLKEKSEIAKYKSDYMSLLEQENSTQRKRQEKILKYISHYSSRHYSVQQLDYIRKTEQMNDCINLVRKEVDREIEESEEKIEKYPGFLTVLCQLDLEKTVGYNQLIFEMDNTFDIKEVYKEKKKDSSDRGILFVFTDFADYDLGIEWHSVNAFLFQKNKIVSNFVKFETDLSEESDRNIFSLEEITNADYEISEKLHEPEMEEYYEEYFGGDNEEFYDNPYFCCDVILLNNNNFYFLTSVYEFEIDKITKSICRQQSDRSFIYLFMYRSGSSM